MFQGKTGNCLIVSYEQQKSCYRRNHSTSSIQFQYVIVFYSKPQRLKVPTLRPNCLNNLDLSLAATVLSLFWSMWVKHMMQLTGSLNMSDLDILVLLDVSALYSQLAGLRVKVNSLHTEGESRPHSWAAHTSGRGLCLHLSVTRERNPWLKLCVSVFVNWGSADLLWSLV